MKQKFHLSRYFTRGEQALWLGSVAVILAAFFLFDRSDPRTLVTSLLGVTSLIFCAKGNPIGQVLMVLFSLLYGMISLSFRYYGEMITYLCMTLPMAVISLWSWLKHPYHGNRSEVAVSQTSRREWLLLAVLTLAVTLVFYPILRFFGTANLLPSTLSVSTSFAAAFLTYRRSPYFALCYAANDLVLILLWGLASWEDPSYISVLVCFAVFLVNDLYGFISWRRMGQRQIKHS